MQSAFSFTLTIIWETIHLIIDQTCSLRFVIQASASANWPAQLQRLITLIRDSQYWQLAGDEERALTQVCARKWLPEWVWGRCWPYFERWPCMEQLPVFILAVSEGYVQCLTPRALLKNQLPLLHYWSLPNMLEYLSSLSTEMEYKGKKVVEHMLQVIIWVFFPYNNWVYLRVCGWTVWVDCLHRAGQICFVVLADTSSVVYH